MGLVDDGCFVAGTSIQIEEGLKSIEEIRPGDWVCSKDEKTGEVSSQQVVRTFQHTTRQIVTVQAGKEKIDTTPEHPFYVDGKGWVRAGSLEVGDKLLTPDNVPLIIRTVKVEAVRGPPVVVYNLEVAGTHTYFVGRQGVWVHNKPAGGKPPRTRKGRRETAEREEKALDEILKPNEANRPPRERPTDPEDFAPIEDSIRQKFPGVSLGKKRTELKKVLDDFEK
jgi:hypothetical protein